MDGKHYRILIDAEPFQPFRIHTSGGQTYDVQNPSLIQQLDFADYFCLSEFGSVCVDSAEEHRVDRGDGAGAPSVYFRGRRLWIGGRAAEAGGWIRERVARGAGGSGRDRAELDLSEPCLEPAAIWFLDEVQEKANKGLMDELAKVGEVYVRRSA